MKPLTAGLITLLGCLLAFVLIAPDPGSRRHRIAGLRAGARPTPVLASALGASVAVTLGLLLHLAHRRPVSGGRNPTDLRVTNVIRGFTAVAVASFAALPWVSEAPSPLCGLPWATAFAWLVCGGAPLAMVALYVVTFRTVVGDSSVERTFRERHAAESEE